MTDSIPKTQQSLDIVHNTIDIAGMAYLALIVNAIAGPTIMQQQLQLNYKETSATTPRMLVSRIVVLRN